MKLGRSACSTDVKSRFFRFSEEKVCFKGSLVGGQEAKIPDLICAVMLWRVVEKRVVEVKLVDLAWAGLFSTQPRYSHFLNDKDYTWPKGAKGGELLSAEKDLEFLESSLGQHMTRTKVSQRKGKRRKGMFRKRSSTSDFLTFCQTWCRDRSGILR